MFTKDEFDAAIKAAGGLKVVAETIGESPQAVLNWKGRGVPANRCKALAAATSLPIQAMRDDWHDYWPELRPHSPATSRNC